MADDIDGPRLTRYISGQCSADEVAAVRRWIAADPSRAQLVSELEATWAASEHAPYEWGVDEAWRALGAAREARQRASFRVIRAGHAPAPVVHPWVGARAGHSAAVRWAAAAVLVLAGSTLTVWRLAFHRPPAVAEAMTEVTTLRGQRATLRLADGTRVTLGTASRLRYARTFGETARDVYLEGDGYFEVVHDSTRPFAVHTARAVARDVGTTFGVRAYANSTATDVVVRDGAVAFGPERLAAAPGTASREALARATPDGSGGVVLRAADVGRLDQNGTLTTTHHADVDGALAWTTGRLVFQDAPLRDVVAELGRWYDIDVQLRDSSIASRRLTATFTNESFPLVLERIALSLDVLVKRHGQTVVLRPRPHAQSAP